MVTEQQVLQKVSKHLAEERVILYNIHMIVCIPIIFDNQVQWSTLLSTIRLQMATMSPTV